MTVIDFRNLTHAQNAIEFFNLLFSKVAKKIMRIFSPPQTPPTNLLPTAIKLTEISDSDSLSVYNFHFCVLTRP